MYGPAGMSDWPYRPNSGREISMSDLYELRRVTYGQPELSIRADEASLPMEEAWEALERAKTAAEAEGWTIAHFSPRQLFIGYRTNPKDSFMTVGVHPVEAEKV
jgi:hypothetical protein